VLQVLDERTQKKIDGETTGKKNHDGSGSMIGGKNGRYIIELGEKKNRDYRK